MYPNLRPLLLLGDVEENSPLDLIPKHLMVFWRRAWPLGNREWCQATLACPWGCKHDCTGSGNDGTFVLDSIRVWLVNGSIALEAKDGARAGSCCIPCHVGIVESRSEFTLFLTPTRAPNKQRVPGQPNGKPGIGDPRQLDWSEPVVGSLHLGPVHSLYGY